MKKYRTHFNVAQDDWEVGEFYDLESEPSLTDPSQAMEIKDILNMFSRGGAVRVLRAQDFGEVVPQEFESITSRLQFMDKTEKAEASLELKELIETKAESIDSTKKAIALEKLEAKIKAEAKAEAKKQNPEKGPE